MRILLVCLCTIISFNTYAQNTIGPTGNVGIGTGATIPQALLHVANGDVLLQNTTSGYPILWSKKIDGSQFLRLDYNSIIMGGGDGVIRTINGPLVLNDAGGNVGIGTASPQEKLSVAGNILIPAHNNYLQIVDRLTLQVTNTSVNDWTRSLIGSNIRWNPATEKWKVDAGPYDDFSMVRFENGGTIGFYTRHVTGSSYEITDVDLKEFRRMSIDYYGNVGIGTDNTYGHKFAVNGSAIFTSVKVKLRENWPDYVFEKGYKLLPLSALEKFIQQNNHLPGIPSAAEVEKEGLDLGQNQAALLKKVEELTLYMIDQNKKLEDQAKQLQQLRVENEQIKKQLTKVKSDQPKQ